MKKLLTLCFLLLNFCNSQAQYLGYTNNGATSETLWYDGSWINSARHQATTNLTVTNILAQIKAATGKYKCAIYAGNASSPSTLLRGSYEVSNPATDGWYSFPLTNAITLTNGQYYWFAVWSDSTTAEIYYNTGTGTVSWGQYSYGSWPSPMTPQGVSGGQNYSIYVTNVVTGPPVAPTITTQPISQTVTAGTNVSFNVVAAGTAPLNYRWRWNGTNISNATNALLSLVSVTTNQAGNYACVVTNLAGSITSSPAVLTVTASVQPPTNIVSYANVTVAWDPSPDASVVGYNFYYGVASRTYTNMANVGPALQITISNLVTSTTYYFAATAYNQAGVESVFSDELVYTVPLAGEVRIIMGVKEDL